MAMARIVPRFHVDHKDLAQGASQAARRRSGDLCTERSSELAARIIGSRLLHTGAHMTQFVEGRTATSWGRIRHVPQAIARPYFRDEVADLFNVREGRSVLAVGAGRSYGDTILNSGGCLVDMTALDRILAFDREAGVLRAE